MSRVKVLIDEDNLTNQAVIVAQLAKLGFAADVVATGIEAIEALEQKGYDLVLMDCDMPDLDGYEATRRIRALGKTDLPIVALTADAMVEDRDRSISAGMNDYLSKPVQLNRLSETFERWLRPAAESELVPAEKALGSDQDLTVFNEATLLNRLMEDRALAGEITRGFLADCPVQLAALCERVKEGDIEGTRRQAHKIKGAASSVEAVSLRAVAQTMERAARAGDLDTVRVLVASANDELRRFGAAPEIAGWQSQESPSS